MFFQVPSNISKWKQILDIIIIIYIYYYNIIIYVFSAGYIVHYYVKLLLFHDRSLFETDCVLTVQSEQSRPASDTLILRRTVATLAGKMTRRAVVVLGLIRIKWTRRIALVLMHYQMMLATGAFVRPILTAGAIGLARHARAVLCVYVKNKKRI